MSFEGMCMDADFMQMMSLVLPDLAGGFIMALEIFAVTLIGALPLGIVIALARMSRFKIISVLARIYISFMRGTPLMLQLMALMFGPYYIFHIAMPTSWKFGACAIGFILNYAAYFAEIYRGGIESMSVGQYEAADVLGYSKFQTFIHIILPQVIKRIMPSITNEIVTLVKDTSLAFAVSYQEMFTIGKQIANSQTSFVPFLVAGVFYYVFNAIVDFVMARVEKKMNYYH